MSQSQTVERGIETNNRPKAAVNTTVDGEILGACLFLGKEELEALGVDDADRIHYTVENGTVKLEVADS
jgi:hypothetical protein